MPGRVKRIKKVVVTTNIVDRPVPRSFILSVNASGPGVVNIVSQEQNDYTVSITAASSAQAQISQVLVDGQDYQVYDALDMLIQLTLTQDTLLEVVFNLN